MLYQIRIRWVAIASLGVLLGPCAPAHAADSATTPLERAERDCEVVAVRDPMADCIRSLLAAEYIGQPPGTLEQYLNYPPLVEYFAWLDAHARKLPSGEPQRARIVNAIRGRTTEAVKGCLQLYASQLTTAYAALAKQLQQAQAELAQLKKAQNAEDREERKTQELIQLMQLMNATAPSRPVTCNTYGTADGNVSTTCN